MSEFNYFDSDKKPISLFKLVRSEPDWAASRIEHTRKQVAQLQAANERLIAERESGYIKWQEKYTSVKNHRDSLAALVDEHCILNELGLSERIQKLISVLAIRDLEQQAKGIEDFLAQLTPYISRGDQAIWKLDNDDRDEFTSKLRQQAKEKG
jgi:hypothetical protein